MAAITGVSNCVEMMEEKTFISNNAFATLPIVMMMMVKIQMNNNNYICPSCPPTPIPPQTPAPQTPTPQTPAVSQTLEKMSHIIMAQRLKPEVTIDFEHPEMKKSFHLLKWEFFSKANEPIFFMASSQ
jgi:hypothetical protein